MTRKQADNALRKLLRALPPLDELLRGSLLERHTFHPSSISCATCASGQGHLQWVLNVIYPGGQTRQISLHPDQISQVRRQIANLARTREILEQVCQLNQQLLRAERIQLRRQPR
jgi:uncharacterized protein DUF6788